MDTESTREAGEQLLDTLIESLSGYGDQADVGALIVVAHVRKKADEVLPVNRGQTIVVPNIAPAVYTTPDEWRARLALVLEDAAHVVSASHVDLDDLPSLED